MWHAVSYSQMSEFNEDGVYDRELQSPSSAKPLKVADLRDSFEKTLEEQLYELDELEDFARRQLECQRGIQESKAQPYIAKLKHLDRERASLQHEIARLLNEGVMKKQAGYGPAWLSFVDGDRFDLLCCCVVIFNLIEMGIAAAENAEEFTLLVFDQLFLLWYLGEFLGKLAYHQRKYFVGPLATVMWNWLDFSIVLGGILDQWLLPALEALGLCQVSHAELKLLRLLRLFRILRFLRLVRQFLRSDLSWTETSKFETFLSMVIALNSFVMCLELDCDEYAFLWAWFEHGFLLVYFFDFSVKFRRWGWYYFVHPDDWLWNLLDFVIVSVGVFDLWLMPSISLIRSILVGHPVTLNVKRMTNILRLLRMMRLLRVLRLVKLMHSIKPLYRLLTGVIAAFNAMKWVLFLTLLVIYACSIVFTSLIGKDMLDDHLPQDKDDFGTVTKSMFSLFKLMNSDTSGVEEIAESLTGKFLFMGFMIVSNWAILAILTSVVSDNMILASSKAEQAEDEIQNEKKSAEREHQIKEIFQELDKDQSGTVSEDEWSILRNDEHLCKMLEDASGFRGTELDELFDCICDYVYINSHDHRVSASTESISLVGRLSTSTRALLDAKPERVLDYRTFANYLRDQSNVARQCSVLHLKAKLRRAETKISVLGKRVVSLEEKIEDGFDRLQSAIELHVVTNGKSKVAADK